MTHSLPIIALLRVEWAADNYQQEPCCPECDAPLYGKNSVMVESGLSRPYHTLEPGAHFKDCTLDQALRTQHDLQTPQERERARRETYPPEKRRRYEYIILPEGGESPKV